MEVVTNHEDLSVHHGAPGSADFSFLPNDLLSQCRSLIESYHEIHGYACLPDTLWKCRLGPLIETNQELRQLLRKASTTRSAKKSNEGFRRIATTLLSLEILASNFSGWSAIHPDAGVAATAILKRSGRGSHMPLMEFYLYPPKYVSLAAIAALKPPVSPRPGEAELYRASRPELADEKQALNYVNAVKHAQDDTRPNAAARSPA